MCVSLCVAMVSSYCETDLFNVFLERISHLAVISIWRAAAVIYCKLLAVCECRNLRVCSVAEVNLKPNGEEISSV